MEYAELKPWRQKWLTPEHLHSAPSARLCLIRGQQWAALEHPRGGPLGCVRNRTGRTATGVARVGGKWCWAFEPVELTDD